MGQANRPPNEMESGMKYLTSHELAARWHMHPQTLANWRVKGQGPEHVKVGTKVLYAMDKVEAWEAENMKQSTAS